MSPSGNQKVFLLEMKSVDKDMVFMQRYYANTGFELMPDIMVVHHEESGLFSSESWDTFQEIERGITMQDVLDIYQI